MTATGKIRCARIRATLTCENYATDELHDATPWRMSHVRALGEVYLVFDRDKSFGPSLDFFVSAFGTYEAAVEFVRETGWKDRHIKAVKLSDDEWLDALDGRES